MTTCGLLRGKPAQAAATSAPPAVQSSTVTPKQLGYMMPGAQWLLKLMRLLLQSFRSSCSFIMMLHAPSVAECKTLL